MADNYKNKVNEIKDKINNTIGSLGWCQEQLNNTENYYGIGADLYVYKIDNVIKNLRKVCNHLDNISIDEEQG